MTDARVGGPVRAWIWGGALLIASVVLRLALSTMLSFGVGVVAYAVPLWAGRAAFAAALLLFVVPLLLGILAIVLGQQSGRPATVPVYPPPA